MADFTSCTTARTSMPSAARSATRMSSAKSRSSSTMTTRIVLLSAISAHLRRDLCREGGHDGGVELPARDRALQYANGLSLGNRRTVGSVGEEGLEPIGDADDPDLERDLLGAKRVGVTGAIEPLVVVAHDRQQPREALEPGEDLLAEDGVALEHRALLR